MKYRLLTVLTCLWCAATAMAQPVVKVQRAWKVDDVVNGETVGELRISPDSHWVAWVKNGPDENKTETREHVFLTSLTDDREFQLTRGEDDCTTPRWSPNGKLLAFLTARPNPKCKAEDTEDDPEAQIWLINPSGGEAWPLTEDLRGVIELAWISNRTLLVVAKESATYYEQELKDGKDSARAVEDTRQEPAVRLYEIDAETGKAKRVTANRDWIKWFVLSPNGSKAVVAHERSLRYNYDHEIRPALFLYDAKTRTEKLILDDGKLRVETVRWTPDGQGFYVVHAATTHPRYLMAYVLEVYYHDLKSGATTRVDLGWDKGLTFTYATDRVLAATNDGFVALLADGVRNKAARFTRTTAGWRREWLTGEHQANLQQIHVTQDGKTVLYQHSSAERAPRYFRARLDGAKLSEPEELLFTKPDYDELPRARCEIVRWKGARDEEVEGLLFYPHDYQRGNKYPLVVSIHGGPFGCDFDAWEEDWASAPNLLCARGAFVFRPNYHGSCNYGLAFAESIANGKYYELPVADIELGVDALIERGLVDADRLGVMGWSNGAILTMALIVHTPRYKAAVAGAGGSEWVGDWGMCEFGAAFDHYYFGKSPLEDPQLYLKLAPFYQFGKVRTPTLLFQGTDDRVVPVHHGWMQFRALQQHTRAPVRLVLFPGEEHSLSKLSHQRRKLKEDLAWFDRHLFRTSTAEQVVKADSPLDRLLKARRAARHGERYGVMTKGVLAPETIRRDELEIGRFEVTRAQFAEFERGYRIEPGTDDFPANGVAFEQARAYCEWLTKQTGDGFRLGTVKELTPIYEEAADSENTLDYWAGYKISMEDEELVMKSLEKLGARKVLKEVGSFAGAGEEDALLFDLGGNVAEWVVGPERTGIILGGSAVTAVSHSGRHDVPREYVGFRVVRPVTVDQSTGEEGVIRPGPPIYEFLAEILLRRRR